jgi:hypothetical protein
MTVVVRTVVQPQEEAQRFQTLGMTVHQNLLRG